MRHFIVQLFQTDSSKQTDRAAPRGNPFSDPHCSCPAPLRRTPAAAVRGRSKREMRSDSQVLLVQSHDLVNKRMFLKCLFAWKLSVSAPHKYYYRFAFCLAKTIMLLLCAVVFLPRQNKGQDLPSQLPICNKNL